MDASFWRNRRVLVTGHTGFKGAWLTLWLARLGARAIGYSFEPPASNSLFCKANVGRDVLDCRGDVRDLERLAAIVSQQRVEVIFHLAAQPLVRRSFVDPVDTFSSNVMGTVHVLDAARRSRCVRSVVVVTTDKCYENHEWLWGYRESDRLGGHDPYSASKACAELVTDAYRRSFFQDAGSAGVATVRAGNVIGGGDWAEDRLIPDAIRAFSQNHLLRIRNPHSVRPWQHVFEPLRGYILLAERLHADAGQWSGAWNFGPLAHESVTVGQLVERMANLWGNGRWESIHDSTAPHESRQLRLDCSKAQQLLQWWPRLNIETSLRMTADWYRIAAALNCDMRQFSFEQMEYYESLADDVSIAAAKATASAKAA